MKPRGKKRLEKEKTKKYKKQLKFKIQKAQGGLRKGLRSALNDGTEVADSVAPLDKEEISMI